ncbi:Cytochrome b5, putative [Perkinsus marinus ATCC 50983]|uniref:Cytochrome b5, putative n=1 Tax=Perkinsus marinus (strain ATCC 50983 / TXsc) TaxID=423536 RepID=C5LIU4_PERM5|nr:Cytochrome b5, putative [Perkinsus marinus ATCC 50983]EER03497.1 Cytochrome b5, putative [Perkinsus marinus ATCC 50983]|eukprot:XP_002771681.1 Cytochrome b5, putative [Perkinsus marinus ATCC 50983]
MLRYDVTKYADRHPGGPRTIYIACGKDCTEVFDHVHSKVKPENILSKDYIGKISGDAPEEQIAGQRRSHNEERKADCPSRRGVGGLCGRIAVEAF